MPQSQLFATSEPSTQQDAKGRFGRTLKRHLIEKGWNQSTLARRAGLKRDAISTYVRGISFPEPHNLHKIANALGVHAGSLVPSTESAAATSPEAPAFELRQLDAAGEQFLVRVHRVVGKETAAELLRLLANDGVGSQSPAT